MAIQFPDPNNPGQFLEYTGPDFSGVNTDALARLSAITDPNFGDKYEFRPTDREKMLGLPGKLYVKGTEELAPEDIRRGMLETQFSLQSGGADLREGTADEIEAKMEADAAAAYDRTREEEKARKLKTFKNLGRVADVVTGGTGIGTAIGTAIGGGDLGEVISEGLRSKAVGNIAKAGLSRFAPTAASGSVGTGITEANINERLADAARESALDAGGLGVGDPSLFSGVDLSTGLPAEALAPTPEAVIEAARADAIDAGLSLTSPAAAADVTVDSILGSKPLFDPSAMASTKATLLDRAAQATGIPKGILTTGISGALAGESAEDIAKDILGDKIVTDELLEGIGIGEEEKEVAKGFGKKIEESVKKFGEQFGIGQEERDIVRGKVDELKEDVKDFYLGEDGKFDLGTLLKGGATAAGIMGLSDLLGGQEAAPDPYAQYLQEYAARKPQFTGFAPIGAAVPRVGLPAAAQMYHGGEVNGPGTGTSDSVPAMLSDGEFVMTAKAVMGAGKGDRDKGAAKMYDMMAKFESMA